MMEKGRVALDVNTIALALLLAASTVWLGPTAEANTASPGVVITEVCPARVVAGIDQQLVLIGGGFEGGTQFSVDGAVQPGADVLSNEICTIPCNVSTGTHFVTAINGSSPGTFQAVLLSELTIGELAACILELLKKLSGSQLMDGTLVNPLVSMLEASTRLATEGKFGPSINIASNANQNLVDAHIQKKIDPRAAKVLMAFLKTMVMLLQDQAKPSEEAIKEQRENFKGLIVEHLKKKWVVKKKDECPIIEIPEAENEDDLKRAFPPVPQDQKGNVPKFDMVTKEQFKEKVFCAKQRKFFDPFTATVLIPCMRIEDEIVLGGINFKLHVELCKDGKDGDGQDGVTAGRTCGDNCLLIVVGGNGGGGVTRGVRGGSGGGAGGVAGKESIVLALAGSGGAGGTRGKNGSGLSGGLGGFADGTAGDCSFVLACGGNGGNGGNAQASSEGVGHLGGDGGWAADAHAKVKGRKGSAIAVGGNGGFGGNGSGGTLLGLHGGDGGNGGDAKATAPDFAKAVGGFGANGGKGGEAGKLGGRGGKGGDGGSASAAARVAVAISGWGGNGGPKGSGTEKSGDPGRGGSRGKAFAHGEQVTEVLGQSGTLQ